MREQENFLNENVNHEGDDVSLSSEIFENVKEDKIEILHNEITNLIKILNLMVLNQKTILRRLCRIFLKT